MRFSQRSEGSRLVDGDVGTATGALGWQDQGRWVCSLISGNFVCLTIVTPATEGPRAGWSFEKKTHFRGREEELVDFCGYCRSTTGESTVGA